MRVFIDGSAGTTGLRLRQRLSAREDICLLTLSEAERKDPARRREALNGCDAAFLCLPDEAAREAVSLLENPAVTVIDASTAHRTSPGWVYGFPELSPALRQGLIPGAQIAVPGCHASGFLALVRPLVEEGLLGRDALLTCFTLTGYSGGGKAMIAEYEAERRSPALDAPRQYALGQTHKHLPEMRMLAGLAEAPVFCPVVDGFYSGLEVTVPLFRAQLQNGADAAAVRDVYRRRYAGPVVAYRETGEAYLSANAYSGRDSMEISVEGNDARILLVARYDNLGKGASGAALQCLNLVFGADECAGLQV